MVIVAKWKVCHWVWYMCCLQDLLSNILPLQLKSPSNVTIGKRITLHKFYNTARYSKHLYSFYCKKKNSAFSCWYTPNHQTVIDYSWMPNEISLRQIGNDFIFISHFVMLRELILFFATIFILSPCFANEFIQNRLNSPVYWGKYTNVLYRTHLICLNIIRFWTEGRFNKRKQNYCKKDDRERNVVRTFKLIKRKKLLLKLVDSNRWWDSEEMTCA